MRRGQDERQRLRHHAGRALALASIRSQVLEQVECWPQVHIAHLATSRNVPLEYWWSAGTAPLLVIQGLDDEVAPPGNGHALREQWGERVRVVDLPDAGHFLLLEQPEAVARAVSEFLGADNAPGK
jgi:pimeloyl-ACP methyl ester carboxylesterase